MTVCLSILFSGSASAHHEAIFGPQSAAVLSPHTFATAQVFTRRTGPSSERTHETTTVLSGGFAPTGGPLSVSVVVPFTFVARGGRGRLQSGLIHPTVTWALNKQVLMFALTSIPVSQHWRNSFDEQVLRVGFGTIYTFGGGGDGGS
jgi:hypothetical protein